MSDNVIKAYLEIEKTKSSEKNQKIVCQFNPDTYSVSKSNSFQSAAAAADTAQMGADGKPANTHKMKTVEEQTLDSTKAATLSLNLLFDTTDERDKPVTKYTAKIFAAMKPVSYPAPKRKGAKPGESATITRPPRVKFGWGKEVSWWAFIESATVTFEFFSSTGVPLRARVQLTLTQAGPDDAYTRQNPTSGTPAPHHIHRVQRGETLDRISARYYGDSTQWRTLAVANGIEDPLGLRPGMALAIPEPGA
ncbi:CIS tube protein [Jatrophihabitans fulvus]